MHCIFDKESEIAKKSNKRKILQFGRRIYFFSQFIWVNCPSIKNIKSEHSIDNFAVQKQKDKKQFSLAANESENTFLQPVFPSNFLHREEKFLVGIFPSGFFFLCLQNFEDFLFLVYKTNLKLAKLGHWLCKYINVKSEKHCKWRKEKCSKLQSFTLRKTETREKTMKTLSENFEEKLFGVKSKW